MSSKGTDGAVAPIADAPTLRSLIERLEAATEGSEELDVRIHKALNPKQRVMVYSGSIRPPRDAEYDDLENFPLENWTDWNALRLTFGAKLYTTSIDAALTLVPEHHLWEVRQGIEAKATVWNLETDYDGHPVPIGYATTFPALALCIAALKARQAAGQGGRTGSGEAASVPNPEVSK